MTATEQYSRLHASIADVACQEGLVPFDVRILVALEERGGEARTDELEAEMRSEGTGIRRSYPTLVVLGLVWADAGEGTNRPKRGTRTRLVLRAKGVHLARRVLREAQA